MSEAFEWLCSSYVRGRHVGQENSRQRNSLQCIFPRFGRLEGSDVCLLASIPNFYPYSAALQYSEQLKRWCSSPADAEAYLCEYLSK